MKRDPASPAVRPSEQTVRDGSYPIARALYFYTRTRPAGDVKRFVDWVLSDDGQKLVGAVGCFPVR